LAAKTQQSSLGGGGEGEGGGGLGGKGRKLVEHVHANRALPSAERTGAGSAKETSHSDAQHGSERLAHEATAAASSANLTSHETRHAVERAPQSVQSMPKGQVENADPGPPSSQWPSLWCAKREAPVGEVAS
jgi:hypothetical protein